MRVSFSWGEVLLWQATPWALRPFHCCCSSTQRNKASAGTQTPDDDGQISCSQIGYHAVGLLSAQCSLSSSRPRPRTSSDCMYAHTSLSSLWTPVQIIPINYEQVIAVNWQSGSLYWWDELCISDSRPEASIETLIDLQLQLSLISTAQRFFRVTDRVTYRVTESQHLCVHRVHRDNVKGHTKNTDIDDSHCVCSPFVYIPDNINGMQSTHLIDWILNQGWWRCHNHEGEFIFVWLLVLINIE